MILLALELNWNTILTFLGGSGITGIAIFLLKMQKERSVDDATKEKLLAESSKIKADADVTVADIALKMAKDLKEEAKAAKEQLAKTQAELTETADMCRSCTYQMDRMKDDLIKEQEKNKQMTAKIDELLARIAQLLEEIAKLKSVKDLK